jgi:hypothetical protein
MGWREGLARHDASSLQFRFPPADTRGARPPPIQESENSSKPGIQPRQVGSKGSSQIIARARSLAGEQPVQIF